MANKYSYVKTLNNGNELVIIVGYVGEGMAHVFERNPKTMEAIAGSSYTLPIKKGIELYLLKD
jgi:hypothetical protein